MTIAATSRPARSAGGIFAMVAAGLAILAAPVLALAQDDNTEARLRKVEAEIRALQRNVFPGGDGRFFEPQITPGEDAAPRPRMPSTSAITDILARLDALELQLQRLTAVSEENRNSLSQVEARLDALEAAQAAAPAESGQDNAATDSNLAAMTGGASSQDASLQETDEDEADEARIEPDPVSDSSASAGPSPDRLEAVKAIAKPSTGDAGEDEYTYGFRLWNAGFYPEARQQLSSFIDGYPDHPLITFGRNLLGRAFLDDGMPEEAARWFLRNYQADRTARRAPDSLLFLAQSMIELGDDRRACIALAEFGDTYPAVASGRLADQYESNRRKVTCE